MFSCKSQYGKARKRDQKYSSTAIKEVINQETVANVLLMSQDFTFYALSKSCNTLLTLCEKHVDSM